MNLEPLKEKIRFVKRHYFPEMVALVVIFGAVGAFASLYASTNRTNLPIPYQGRLLDSNFVPVADGTYYMKFALYTSATGTSSCVWETGSAAGGAGNCNSAINSSSTPVTVNRGNFTVLLGDDVDGNNPPLSADSFNFETNAFYLGITACGTNNSCDAQMTPRRQLGGTPYSYNADMVDGWDPSSGASGGMTLVGGYTNNAKFTLIGNTAINNTLATSSIIFMVGNSGSTTAMTILNNGMIGIGTSTPSGLLTLGDMTISTTPSLTGGFFSFASSTLNDNGTTAGGTLTNAALLSIGQGVLSSQNNSTTTNAYGLYLAGAPVNGVNTTSTNTTALYIGAGAVNGVNTPTNSYGLYVNAQTGATNNYAAYINGTSTFIGGNVGIGTTSPSAILEISKSSTETNPVTNDTLSAIRIQNTATAAAGIASALNFISLNGTRMSGIYGIRAGTSGNEGHLAFATNPESDFLERMRITNTGYVGIGTTTPQTLLHLRGTGASDINTLGTATLTIEPTLQNVYPAILLKTLNGSNYGGAGIMAVNVTNWDSELVFFNNAAATTTRSERMRITNSGNVGIGTTAPGKKLDIDDTTAGSTPTIRVQNSNSGTGTSSTATIVQYVNGSSNNWNEIYVYGMSVSGNFGNTDIASARATAYLNDSEATIFANYYNRPMYFIQRASEPSTSPIYTLTMAAGGNVGIGTTTPQSLLHVGSGGFAQFEKSGTASPSNDPDCNNDSEIGRIYFETDVFKYWVCMGATPGWKSVTLN